MIIMFLNKSLHERGTHINEQMKARAKVTSQFTTNGPTSARKRVESTLKGGAHRYQYESS
jgi:hypothetical protein